MLSNSVVGGLLAAAYLGLLILQLNPSLPLQPMRLAPLAFTIVAFYGTQLAIMFYAVIVLRQLVSADRQSPGWLSFGIIVWLSAAISSAGAALMWLNLRGLRAVIAPESAGRMASGAVALTGCAVLFLIIAFATSAFGRRRSRLITAVFVLTLVSSVVLPGLFRGPRRQAAGRGHHVEIGVDVASAPVSPRVVMLLLDGASLDLISPAAAEGRLPNFGKILDSGAVMHLATLRPTQPEPVWTAVATGKLPYKNGVRSAANYLTEDAAERVELLPDFCFAHGLVHFGLLAEEPHSSAALQVRPLWSILGGMGISAGIVGWPLSHPAERVRGYLVTDHFYRHGEPLSAGGGAKVDVDEALVYPPELLATARAAAERRPSAALVRSAVALAAGPPAIGRWPPRSNPQTIDVAYEQVAGQLQLERPAQVTAVRYQSLDAAGHYFLRYATPRAFGDVSEDERRRYGRVLEQYYSVIDAVLGRALASLGREDLLLVVSGFGMEPLSISKRMLERVLGNAAVSGSHEAAPDGFLLAYGAGVAAARLTRASVVDVTPTVLYYLGLPVARDMDGYARTDIFTRDFTAERPITFIPSYEH